MEKSDKIKRIIAFYSSVTLFFILLPVLLSYSLGYKLDLAAFKIHKTGILYINSNPAGASVYINGKLCGDLTPVQIEELKPGTYKVEVRREGFYPWEKELAVKPNMATRADKIILFPVIQDLRQVFRHKVSDFTISDRNEVYYMTEYGLFKSNMDGSGLKRLSLYSDWPKDVKGKKFSPNGARFLYFTERTVYAVNLNIEKTMAEKGEEAKVEEALTADDPIVDVFWYADSGYIIIVTKKAINITELRGGGVKNTVSLYKFNAKPGSLYYDEKSGSLYFTDAAEEPDLTGKRYLYRLDLRQKFFDNLMQLLLKKEPVKANRE